MGSPVSSNLFLVILGVLLDEFLLIVRYVLERMNRIGRAGGHAGATIDAAFRIHVHLGGGLKAGFLGLGMDAIGGADFNTKGVLDAGIGNYIGHDESISADGMSLLPSSGTSVRTCLDPSGDWDHTELCVKEIKEMEACEQRNAGQSRAFSITSNCDDGHRKRRLRRFK